MQYESLDHQKTSTLEVGVYECEVHLKFRLIEEKGVLTEHDRLLEILMDAFAYGADEYLESIQAEVSAHEVSELQASPQMRRQLIRLRNSSELTGFFLIWYVLRLSHATILEGYEASPLHL